MSRDEHHTTVFSYEHKEQHRVEAQFQIRNVTEAQLLAFVPPYGVASYGCVRAHHWRRVSPHSDTPDTVGPSSSHPDPSPIGRDDGVVNR
jgi:hypothetical protein